MGWEGGDGREGGCRDKSALCCARLVAIYPSLPSREPAHGTKTLCSTSHKEPFKHFSTAPEYPSNYPLNRAPKINKGNLFMQQCYPFTTESGIAGAHTFATHRERNA